jgi:SAM-dependent methyltransferase
MLAASRARIEQALPPDAVVLDIGGWADPLPRADWVIDLLPYETRGLYGEGAADAGGRGAAERFSKETWIERDACSHEPFPFNDDEIDFVVCSHTLEDVRDPIRICSEIVRVGKAGYVEVPSRLEEQAWGVAGPFVGWSHHRWLIDLTGDRFEFVHKPSALQALPDAQIPVEAYRRLPPGERVHALFWEGGFGFEERVIFDQEEHDRYLAEAPRRLDRDEAVLAEPDRKTERPGRSAALLSRLRRTRDR